MTPRRGAALIAALGTAGALAVAVPFAAADRGKDDKKGSKPAPSAAAPAAPAVATGSPAKRALFQAVLQGAKVKGEKGSKSSHHRKGKNAGGASTGQGLVSITVKDSTLCYAILTQGIDAIQSADISDRNGKKLLGLPVNKGAIGDPNAVAFCITVNAAGVYDPADAGLDLAKLRRKPEKFVVTVRTTAFPNGAVAGRLKKVSPHKG